MAHSLFDSSREKTEDKWARQRIKATELCTELGQKYPPCGFSVGDGWFPVVADALRKIAKVAKDAGLEWELAQVKQKFCQLRIYVDIDTPGVNRDNHDSAKNPWLLEENHPLHFKYKEIRSLIGDAEDICDTMCESCGNLTEGGQNTGWKGCSVCKETERKEYGE